MKIKKMGSGGCDGFWRACGVDSIGSVGEVVGAFSDAAERESDGKWTDDQQIWFLVVEALYQGKGKQKAER